MTNNEYIQKQLSLFGITQETIDVILADSDLIGDAYLDKAACKAAVLKDFYQVRTAAHRNVSEGGFSLSWNDCEKALQDFEKALADDTDGADRLNGYGCVDRSYLW